MQGVKINISGKIIFRVYWRGVYCEKTGCCAVFVWLELFVKKQKILSLYCSILIKKNAASRLLVITLVIANVTRKESTE